MKLIIGIVGQQASGKGTIAAYLEKAYGAKKFRFSDSLFDILGRLHLSPTRDNLIKLSEILRGTFGEEILANTLTGDVQKTDAPLIVVDGVRRAADIVALERAGSFHLTSVDASPEIRYQRAKKRMEKPEEANFTFEEFLALHNRSTEVSARELAPQAEITFDNNAGEEELHEQIDAYLASLGVKK